MTEAAREALESIFEDAKTWQLTELGEVQTTKEYNEVKEALDRLDELEELNKSNTELIGVFNVRELALEADLTTANKRIEELEREKLSLRDQLNVAVATGRELKSDLSKSQKWILQQTKDLSKSRKREKRLIEQLDSWPPGYVVGRGEEVRKNLPEKQRLWQAWLDEEE